MDRIEPALRAAAPAGVSVAMTGFEQIQSSSGGGGSGPSVLIETAIGAVAALAVLAFVFGSAIAIVPLLIAIPSILTTFLLVLGLTACDQCQLPRRVPGRADGARCRDRLLAAADHPLARGTRVRPLQRGGDPRRRADCGPRGRAERHDRRGRAALARAPAGSVPAQHRARRDADPARRDRRRDHAASSDARRMGTRARQAARAPRLDNAQPAAGNRGARPSCATAGSRVSSGLRWCSRSRPRRSR